MKLYTVFKLRVNKELEICEPCICGTFDKVEDAWNVVEDEKKLIEKRDKKCDDWGCWVTDGVCEDQCHYFISKSEAKKIDGTDDYVFNRNFKKIKKMDAYVKIQIFSYPFNERGTFLFKDD